MYDYDAIIKLNEKDFIQAFNNLDSGILYIEKNSHLCEIYCDEILFDCFSSDIPVLHCFNEAKLVMTLDICDLFIPYFVFNEIKFELRV